MHGNRLIQLTLVYSFLLQIRAIITILTLMLGSHTKTLSLIVDVKFYIIYLTVHKKKRKKCENLHILILKTSGDLFAYYFKYHFYNICIYMLTIIILRINNVPYIYLFVKPDLF